MGRGLNQGLLWPPDRPLGANRGSGSEREFQRLLSVSDGAHFRSRRPPVRWPTASTHPRAPPFGVLRAGEPDLSGYSPRGRFCAIVAVRSTTSAKEPIMSDDPMTNPGSSGGPEGEGAQPLMPPIGQQNPPGLGGTAPAPQEPVPPVPYAQWAPGAQEPSQQAPFGDRPAQGGASQSQPYLQQPPMPQQAGIPPQGPGGFQPAPPSQQPGVPQQPAMLQQAAPQQPPVPPRCRTRPTVSPLRLCRPEQRPNKPPRLLRP